MPIKTNDAPKQQILNSVLEEATSSEVEKAIADLLVRPAQMKARHRGLRSPGAAENER